MENDQAFAADANIDRLSESQDRPERRGYDAMKKASGAFEASNGHDQEDTPLLSRAIDEEYENTSEGEGRENNNEQNQWTGATDFEGRPWWNRPSVSLTSLLF